MCSTSSLLYAACFSAVDSSLLAGTFMLRYLLLASHYSVQFFSLSFLFFLAHRSLLITCYIRSLFSTRYWRLTFRSSRISSAGYCALQADYCSARFEFSLLASDLFSSLHAVCYLLYNGRFLLSRACYTPLIPSFLLLVTTSLMFAVHYPWYGSRCLILITRYFLLAIWFSILVACCPPLAEFCFKFAVCSSLLEARCHYSLPTAWGPSAVLVASW